MKSKKMLAVLMVTVLSIGVTTGVYGASVAKKISAIQNAEIKIKVDGNTLKLADSTGSLDPIVYNGHTYVPAKAVAEAMGGAVTWDGANNTVIISTGAGIQDNSTVDDEYTEPATNPTPDSTPTSKPATTPTPDSTPAPESTPAPATTNGTASTNKGSLTDPISLGTSFTYNDYYHYKEGDKTYADYTFTIKKVVPITNAEIVKLGFREPESDPKVEHVMVTVSLKVANAKIVKGTAADADGYQSLSLYKPKIWGVKTPEGASIIGGNDYGFDGSLGRNISDIMDEQNFPKVLPGQSKSYEVTGNVLMPVYKDKTNYFVLSKSDNDIEYANRFIYFKLK